MYGNPYLSSGYNPQANIERINNQIAELEKMKSQIPLNNPMQAGQPAINQTFQLAPTNGGAIKYVNNIEDVNKEMVFGDTPFFSKDLSVLWVKNAKGEVKSYELREIVQKDEKDIQIEYLLSQIEELKKGAQINAEPTHANINEPTKSEEPANVPNRRTTKTK